MAYVPNTVGSANSANSQPVVIATDQAAFPIKGYDSQDDMMKIKSLQKKFRDSFVGAAVDSAKWASSVGTGGSVSVSGGVLTMNSGTTINSETILTSVETFTIPFRVTFQLQMSQRINNQAFYVEAVSVNASTGVADGLNSIAFVFDGTTATNAKYSVQNGGGTALVSGGQTFTTTGNGTGVYEMEPFADEAWFHSGVLDSSAGRANSYRRHQQIPDPNAVYKLRLRWLNGGTAPSSSTSAQLQFVACQDYAELTAEITAGRGIAVAGQSMGVSVVNTPSVSVSNTPAVTVSGTATVSVSNTPTVDTELPAAGALGDTLANPTSPMIGANNLLWDGSNWVRMRADSALAGNGANNTVVGIPAAGVGPGFSIRYNPTNLATATNSASTIDTDGASGVTLAINTVTSGTFIIEGTADNTNWIPLEVFDSSADLWVSGENITPITGKVYQIVSQGYRQVRIRTTATLGATVAHFWTLTLGNQVLAGIDTGPAPHNFGYLVRHFNAEYTTAQTGTALWTPTTGRKFVVTDITISTGGTTAGVVTLWQGAAADTTYTVGTDRVIFRGEFAPSATSKPGVVKNFMVPFVSNTTDHVLRVTTSAAMTVYIQVNGYDIQ